MRVLLIAVLLCLSTQVHAVSFTFTENTEGCEVFLPTGMGKLKFATSGNGFGGGDATVQTLRELGDSTDPDDWDDSKVYQAIPSPNPERMDFGAPTRVKIVLTGSASPTLYCEIVPQIRR
jgi:hypothetical protein